MRRTPILVLALFVFFSAAAWSGDVAPGAVVAEAFPSLSSGALSRARLADLPDGVLLQAGDLRLMRQTVDAHVAGAPKPLQAQYDNNRFFLLEETATGLLLLQAAERAGKNVEEGKQHEAIRSYLDDIAEAVRISEDECRAFYEENKGMMGGSPFEQVMPQIEEYLLHGAKRNAVEEHIRTLGDRMEILVDRRWTEEQARRAMDNPVDKARASGMPTMVDFGAHGCGPCDMMTPILVAMEKKYAGKANILFVPVREEQILSARYGIQGIPVQIFFDKEGKEVFRHVGFLPREECENWLKKAGGE